MDPPDWILATYRPQHPETLNAAAREWIGWRGIWRGLFIIEDGPHKDEWACQVRQKHRGPRAGPPAAAFKWVPESDLEPITLPPAALDEVQRRAEEILKDKMEGS